ncbi:histone deacetylation rxt3 [Pyrenophora seminiperda CCB06]|uniref:Histone deacetylation rxt3 n=1 Tax=Pyrenophora seminiperda CCB06 TaxID=1302712 RepID=A0A3M7M991_9PLEO|nr:histone deacetylation rxt3 [Pyrenophora seminiperda CCB06]
MAHAPMNYHSQTTHAYPAYAPTSQPQAQPQQPVHAPYLQQDPYSVPRRDPFYPSAPQHVRHSSQGGQAPPAGNTTPQGQAESQQGQGGWPATGMEAPSLQEHMSTRPVPGTWCERTLGQCVPRCPDVLAQFFGPRPQVLKKSPSFIQAPGPSESLAAAVQPAYTLRNSSRPGRPSTANVHLKQPVRQRPIRLRCRPQTLTERRQSSESLRYSPASHSEANSPTGPSHDPPLPPSFARPQMPPPSSPTHQHPHASQPQRTQYPSNFGANRELPGLGQAMRPGTGSSMSISSLIGGGGDTGAPVQTTQSQSSPATSAPSSNGHSMQPPSPRRALPSGQRPDFTSFRRQPTPERSMYGSNTSRPSEGHAFSAVSPRQSYSTHGSPDLGRQSLPPTTQSYKPMNFPSQRPYAQDANRQPPGGIPPRPSSQPTGPLGDAEQEGRPAYDVFGGRRSAFGPPEERRRTLGESHRPNPADLLADGGHIVSERDRSATVHPVSQSVFSPPQEHRNVAGSSEPPRSLWRHSAPTNAGREPIQEGRQEEPPAMHRTYGSYPLPMPGGTRYTGQGLDDMLRRNVEHLGNRVVEQYHAPPTSDPNSLDRHRTEPLSRSLSSGGRSLYDQPPKMGEAMQHSKSHIGFGLEASRRTGRASPLPQAVQGAQAQPLSIGKDPGIKSEFGRMFSGLGSGLGSSTPSRGSPLPQGSFESDNGEMMRRIGSQQGRKLKRVKDEEGIFDLENTDGRGTPSSTRGAKRGKHHHHHAPHHHHHHHHHHHKPDDEVPLPSTSNPINGRQPSVPQAGPGHSVHHHHHIQGNTHHHHHHAPRANQQVPLVPTKMSTKVHHVQPILEEAAKRPRKHLGSQLYEAKTELPKANSSLDDQFGYASKPQRLPRFDVNPINCTFTIRVPRYYLKPRQRQHVVLERHLWGARVYRDDSDPIAAAIHSGWIRGEWDDTVDVAMLDPRITAPNDPSDAEDVLTKMPAAPVTPPADMDLQIEILILPQLQEYTGSVEYGISSRKSKGHEGLSFMINKIRWVEEGIGSRGQERTAAALKRRLDASATLLALQSGIDNSHGRVNGMATLHA